uniref:tRNA methyltransferase 10 homolog C n=1 Tax=Astyanax mexicanus TaxID=7994 RepID=A0A8B9HRN2_ASTMX
MTFLRLQVVGVLRRCCGRPSSSAALKCHYSGLPTSSFISTPSSALTSSRALSTTWILRKDVPQPKDEELKNTFLMKFWSRSLDTLLFWRSAQAMQYGQPLVFDMSYDQHMSSHDAKNTVSQLLQCEGWNRRSVDPFHLHFCNLQPNSVYHQELLKRYGQETWERLFITTTSQRHVDIFPRENLVYLTADSPNVLRTFDHNKVYIIGAFVDRSAQSGVSLANAKRLKLATARLPLNEHLQWDCGAKNLTLDQMIQILITIKETGSWEKALEFVPIRKHGGFYDASQKKHSYYFFVLYWFIYYIVD